MEQFDIVIIGSGLGGLVCANILGREGKKVCVIEKNKQIGGSLQTFVRDKVIFDTGVHYIGGLEKGQNLYQIFKYLGVMDNLKLQKMDEDAFDKIVFEGDENEYPLAQGYDNFINQLLKFFPEEEAGIRAYCDEIKEVCSKFPLYNLQKGGSYDDKAGVIGIDTKTFIDSITNNHKLRQVLAGNNPLYAGKAEKTPLYVHSLVLNSYIESSWKCIDGGSQIGKMLAKGIKSFGGVIKRNSEVAQIVEENGKVTHVTLADGSKIYADEFISNIHPAKTLEKTKSEIIRPAYRNRINNLENSISSFTLSIVLKKDSFKYLKHNYYYHDVNAVWEGDDYTTDNWPRGYALFWSPSSKSVEYADAVSVLAYMKYEEVKQWENSYNTVADENDRGEGYEEFKKQKAEALIAKIEQKFPGFSDCIQSYYTSTPLSYRDYIGTDDGSMYGVSKDYQDPLKSFISPRTKIPNLHLTGQNLNLHGVLGVTISAVVTCSSFIEPDLLIDKINNA
ncbi:all-trans-retinol 13,14-reductase [Solitalea longa]|uniref:All-trans-retinol 13,14-reductase n=1 Tax=Solitalea longa TaxID=2079460 RepID=A0A2S5A1Y1_9SPHI|nr:NAD(P)/FAD-dependent oxidoreductase [Solitalea longa]POY36555.1 all-trans-retinol 13,14-reductase [Solitalea longa]